MSDFSQNNIQEPFIIEMKKLSSNNQSSTACDKKRLYKSEYVKSNFPETQSTIDDENALQYDPSSAYTNYATQYNTQRKVESHRYTDGYFLKSDELIQSDIEKSKKQFLKLSLVGLTGCGVSPSEETKRVSFLQDEQYREFNTTLTPTGYGFIADYFYLIWNLFMNQFSKLMKYLGRIVGKLEQKYSSHNVGYAMMAVSTILHLIPTLYVKLNPQIDFSVTLMARGIVSMFLLFCMSSVKNQKLISFCKSDMIILVVRGFLTAISQLYFFYAVKKMPLSINYVINNTGPIFVFLMSALFFGVTIKKKEIVGIAISVLGVLCITNPDLILGIFSSPQTQEIKEQTITENELQPKFQYAEGTEKLILIIVFVIIYIGWAYGIVIVKKIKEANTVAMNFYVGLACFLSGAISFYARDQSISHLTLFDFIGLIVIVGIFCFGSQYTFITSTFLNQNHGPLSMLNYLSVVESYIVQMAFFNEVPSTVEISGSLLVLVGLSTILINI